MLNLLYNLDQTIDEKDLLIKKWALKCNSELDIPKLFEKLKLFIALNAVKVSREWRQPMLQKVPQHFFSKGLSTSQSNKLDFCIRQDHVDSSALSSFSHCAGPLIVRYSLWAAPLAFPAMIFSSLESTKHRFRLNGQ